MRIRRWIGAAMLAGATLAWPSAAWADGGAYLDLDRTHYLPGQTARAEGYVSIPRVKRFLVERGPFYVFVVPERTAVIEGRPIPADAVRVGTVSIERDRGSTFELHASFIVPDLASRSYGLRVCNDPCTISGFREPLSGAISIVATAREGELLTEISGLNGRIWGLRRQVHKAERATEETRALLTDAEIARSALASRVLELESIGQQAPPAAAPRPMLPDWSAIVLALGLIALALALLRRRRPPPEHHGPDPIASPESPSVEPRDRAHSAVG
jgi:MYXO-CTERM domain-containing protein